MGDTRRKRCKRCGEPDAMTGELSWTGLCTACGLELRRANFDAMLAKSGAPFLHWRRKHAASVGAVLLDDLSEDLARAVVDHLTGAAQQPNVTAA